LSSAGQVVFRGTLSGPGVTDANNVGVWSEGSGSLALVIIEGGQIPGENPGVLFREPLPPSINDSGQTAFMASTNPSGPNLGSAIWVKDNSSTTFNIMLKRQVPGMDAGVTLTQYGARRLIDNAGRSMLSLTVTGAGIDSTNDQLLWQGDHDGGVIIAREGNQAPGTGAGVNFSAFDSPYTSGTGGYAFEAYLVGPGVDAANNEGIWAGAGGSTTLIARTGDNAPGTGPGVGFASFYISGPVINNGDVLFHGNLTGAGADNSNDTGVWFYQGGSTGLVVREGDPATDLGAGIEVGEITTGPSFNSTGTVGFHSLLTGPGIDGTNDSAIWEISSGVLSVIAREGSQAPGTNPGTVFNSLTAPAINDSGQLVFGADLTGSGVDNTNDRGVWAQLGAGLELIAREGNSFEVAPGDLREIDVLSFFGGPDQFNNLGQILFHASFTDGSQGLFVASVPEPGTTLILTSLMPLILRRQG
jgi:hypothetical protein